MIAPTVNVFITFEAEEMLEFLDSKSLQAFSDKQRNGKSLLFSNAPNSSLISLDHSFRTEGKPELTLKFLDPEDEFLKMVTPSEKFFTNLTLKKSQLDAAGSNAANLAETSLQNQLDLRENMLSRTIFITYGVGDNVARDWCPPMLFSNVIDATYRMDARRAKEITLTYDGKGSIANLGILGIDFLRNFANSVIIKGTSWPLLNIKAAKKIEKVYPFIKDHAENPSLHLTIRTTLDRFIQSATSTDNVLVFLPDLDKYLKPFFDKKKKESELYELSHKSTLETTLMNLGFTISIKNRDMDIPFGITPLLGSQELDKENFDAPTPLYSWIQTKEIRAVLKTNGLEETFLSKLDKVTKLIKEKVTQYPVEDGVDEGFFDAKIRVENNFQILKLLKEKKLIKSDTRPAVIFTTDFLYSQIISGGLVETNSENLDSDETKESFLQEILSAYDNKDGLSYDYVKEVYEALNPPIPTIGPFVGLGSSEAIDDLLLSEDSNIDKSTLETLKKDQSSSTTRVPIFSFGTKNSNILSVNINVNPAIVTLVNSFKVVNNPTNVKTTLALATTKNKTEYEEILDVLEASGTEYAYSIDDVPKKFVDIIKVLHENDSSQSFKGSDFSNSLKDLGLVDEQLKDLDIKAEENKDDFYVSLWNSFNILFRQDGAIMEIPQNLDNAVAKVLRTSNIITDLGNQAISGGIIKTLPYFNLGSAARVGTKRCLIFGKESNIYTSDYDKDTYSWYSGIYKMFGFRNYITKSDVFSEFSVSREPSGGGLIKF